jgi:hypothetical protein
MEYSPISHAQFELLITVKCIGCDIPRNRYWDVMEHLKDQLKPIKPTMTVHQDGVARITFLGI